MPFDPKDRWWVVFLTWLPAYLVWLGAFCTLSILLGLAVAAWDRAVLTPGEPGFVYPSGQQPAAPTADPG